MKPIRVLLALGAGLCAAGVVVYLATGRSSSGGAVAVLWFAGSVTVAAAAVLLVVYVLVRFVRQV